MEQLNKFIKLMVRAHSLEEDALCLHGDLSGTSAMAESIRSNAFQSVHLPIEQLDEEVCKNMFLVQEEVNLWNRSQIARETIYPIGVISDIRTYIGEMLDAEAI